MPIDYAAVDAELGPAANNVIRMCFAKFRFIPACLKDELHKAGVWDDLVQETYLTAWEAWQNRLSLKASDCLIGRRIRDFFKAYGYHRHWHGYYKLDKAFSAIAQDGAHLEKLLARANAAPRPIFSGDHLEEKILAILRENPGGMVKWKLYSRLGISAQELEWQCRPLIEQGLVAEVKRENVHGRPLTPLLVAVQPDIALPAPELAKTENFELGRNGWKLNHSPLRN